MMHNRSYGSRPILRKDALETTLALCQSLLEEIDTPRALTISLLIRHGEWDQLALGVPISAASYLDAQSFFLDYQATQLLVKADFLPTSFDRKAAALVRFESAESLCRETNRRFRYRAVDVGLNGPLSFDGLLSETRKTIHKILGRFPHEKLLDSCRWGPGATTSIRNPRTSVYEKYLESFTGSGLCFSMYLPMVREVTLWSAMFRGFLSVTDSNKVVFVAKNAKTERSIASEPTMNSFIQLGIGALMRERLRRHGIDLNTQERNRDLARYGSLTGKVATIDLSMASDTVSTAVVEELLPADWLLAMKCARSPSWRRGKVFGWYHKFSSMGNGYTFELETLIFYAAARAVSEELGLPWWEVTAFGDDLTIGTEGVDRLTAYLAFLGFKVNIDKSFDSGVFRESCGKDYFLGTDVRPYFVKSLLRDVRDLKKFHNGVLKGLIPFPSTAAKALRLAESQFRLFGPKLLGDTVFFSPTPRGWFKPASKVWPMYEGFVVRHWVFKPDKTVFKFLEPAILASLYSNREAPSLGKSTQRGRGTWVTKTTVVPGWDD